MHVCVPQDFEKPELCVRIFLVTHQQSPTKTTSKNHTQTSSKPQPHHTQAIVYATAGPLKPLMKPLWTEFTPRVVSLRHCQTTQTTDETTVNWVYAAVPEFTPVSDHCSHCSNHTAFSLRYSASTSLQRALQCQIMCVSIKVPPHPSLESSLAYSPWSGLKCLVMKLSLPLLVA